MDKDQRQFLRSTLIVLAPTVITLVLLLPATLLGGGSYGSLLVGAGIGQWVYGVWWSQVHPALTVYLQKESQDTDVPVAQSDRASHS